MFSFGRKYTVLLFSFLMLFTAGLFAEQFRVAKLHTVQLTDDVNSEAEAALELNDGLAIYLPESRVFIEGIEIKMTIPEETALWRDCCACVVYDSVNPSPKKEQIDFSGNKIFFEVLPGKLSWYLQIPLTDTKQFKTNQYTTRLEKKPDLSGNYIFLRLQQVMKGVPDTVLDSVIKMSVKPILSNKGILKLNIQEPEIQTKYQAKADADKTEEAEKAAETTEQGLSSAQLNNTQAEDNSQDEAFYTVFVDDNPVQGDLDKILLNTGIHNVSVISESYRTEVRNVRIEQAKISDLDILLKSIEPTLIITAPEGTQIQFDGEPFSETGKEIIISEGEHKVTFIIGDYEIIRSISAIKGKTYKANLAVDLQISEE